MQMISGITTSLSDAVLARMASYRYRVFIETLKWELPVENGMELDQFDRPDTLYVLSHDDQGDVNGCARLLPTTRPYLLGDVFPQLLTGLDIPCSPDIWELSRFAAVDFNNQTMNPLQQFSSPIAVNLLRESIATAAAHGAKRLITVSPLGIERLLRRAGFRAHRAGPPMVIDGHAIFACWIEVEPQDAPAAALAS
ncbi:MAG: acyl-homoserine-lactone synthase [Telluria sp.]